jgi:hypothetical protein
VVKRGTSTCGRPAAVRKRLEELVVSLFLWASVSFTGNGVRGRLPARAMGERGAGSLTTRVNPVRNVCKVRATDGWVRISPARAIADGGESSGSACWISVAVRGGGMASWPNDCAGTANPLFPICDHAPLRFAIIEPTGKLHSFPRGARRVDWTTLPIILSGLLKGAKELSGVRSIERYK